MRKYESRTKVILKPAQILRWRARNEFTQKEAAAKAGVSLPTYQRAEYGRAIQLVSASHISKAMRIPLEQLEEKSA